jgi:hypothetical protein
MFSKKELGVVDWWIFFIVMAIPFVNIVVFLMLLLSEGTNKCLKNYLLALILPVIIILFLVIFTGFGLGFLNSL